MRGRLVHFVSAPERPSSAKVRRSKRLSCDVSRREEVDGRKVHGQAHTRYFRRTTVLRHGLYMRWSERRAELERPPELSMSASSWQVSSGESRSGVPDDFVLTVWASDPVARAF